MLDLISWRILMMFGLFFSMAFCPPLIVTLIQQPIRWLQTPDQRLRPPAFLGTIFGVWVGWTLLGIALLLRH